MAETRHETVLRLARTMPRRDQPGIGLHCFHYARLSRFPSLVVTKKIEGTPLLPREDTLIVEVAYRDRSVTREKLTFSTMIAVGLSKIYGDIRITAAALSAVKRNRAKIAIIHIHSANYLLSGILLKAILRVPICLNFGGTELIRAKEVPLYRWFFQFLDRGFYVARDMEARLFPILQEDRCVYTGNGIDHERFYDDPNAEKRDEIVCVGNLRWQKDYPTLISAFARISNEFPTYRIRIFGEGPERKALETIIAESGLQDRVVLEGMRSQEAIRDVMQQAKLFVISSKNEGFPKALIEAMACGLPIVATDAGECSAVLGPIAPTVPVGDARALAESISKILADPELQKSLAAVCVKRSQDFSWQQVASTVEATYSELLG